MTVFSKSLNSKPNPKPRFKDYWQGFVDETFLPEPKPEPEENVDEPTHPLERIKLRKQNRKYPTARNFRNRGRG